MQRRSVDLPQPEGPMRQTTWCSLTLRFVPFRTSSGPKNFTTSWISRNSMMAPLARGPHAPLIAFKQLVHESCLGNGDDHENDRENSDCGQVEGVGCNDARLIEPINYADD